MSARADTDLMWLQTRAASLSRRDCYDLDAEACLRIIEQHDPRDASAQQVASRFNRDFYAVFGATP